MTEITVLIENENMNNNPKLLVESGLALFVKTNENNLLFDTGASANFVKNSKMLNKDLKTIDACIISHGHYDHTGGIDAFCGLNTQARIFMKPEAENEFYFKLGFIKKYIGPPSEVFQAHSERIEFISQDKEILPGVHILTKIKSTRKLAKGNKKLHVKSKKTGKLEKDDFIHEIIGVIEENDELIVITGCSHNGVRNMIDTVKEKFPNKKIKALIGGFHLMGIPLLKNSMSESPETIQNIARELLEYEIPKIYTNHCTGTRAYGIMKEIMADSLEYLSTGEIREI